MGIESVVEDITEQREADRISRKHKDRIMERERARLAEAVHDDPLQRVVAAILRLDSLQPQLPESALVPVAQVAGLLEQAVEGLRRLIVTVSLSDLSGGLGAALRVLAEGIFIGTTTQVDVGGQLYVPLRVDTKWQAYRVLREALINARKHASAHNVRISLQESPRWVELSVADDGIGGASSTSDPGHLGMATMNTRAASMKGTLTLTSTPGHGTTVELRLPREAWGRRPGSGWRRAAGRRRRWRMSDGAHHASLSLATS